MSAGGSWKFKLALLLAVLPSFSIALHAQEDYFSHWFERVEKTQAEQPHWLTPVATTTPRLEEEFRYDQLWLQDRHGVTTNVYGGSKGLELIPLEKVEVIFILPPYLDHNSPTAKNGFGDAGFLVKYRLLASNEQHGNYILTAFLGWTVPTGSYANGARHAVITPTIAYGKGRGIFDVQGTLGVGLPVADGDLLGRTYAWNNAFQMHLLRKLWPEVEINSTFFQAGKNDGKKQTFVTPGLVLGKFHLWRRMGFTLGGGYQIATTRFHATNHNGILSVRFPF